jgi:tetratricopeptide (TPR) repeat protein
MSLTLLKLEDRHGSRNWVRTARILAAETGDLSLQAWVHAQEAYFHFYDRNLISAIESAQHAETLSNVPNVGSVLATALEARANAILGRQDEATSAASRAENYLESLDSSLIEPSAFGYDEAQLRFHQGSALTQLGKTRAALAAQERALELYPEENYLDRALVQLDKAQCLILDRDFASAIELAAATFSELERSQAKGMIAGRVMEILELLTPEAQSRSEVLELRAAIDSVEINR